MNTNVAGVFTFLDHFVLAKLGISSIRVKSRFRIE